MRGEAEEEAATATGRAVLYVTSDRKLHILAREDKADPKTSTVNKEQLITSQPGDKDTPIFLLPILSASFHSKLPSPLNPPQTPLHPILPKILMKYEVEG